MMIENQSDIVVYKEENDLDENINSESESITEDKTNLEKNLSYEYKTNEIFKASDQMVDSLTQLIARVRKKKEN